MQIENNILYGGPIAPNITQGTQSLGEYCLKKLNDKGNEITLIDGCTYEIVTASELLAKSKRLAECLKYYGIKPGDVIGFSSENCIDFACIVFATFFVGACVAPINPTYTEREIVHAFNLSRPKLVFLSDVTMKETLPAITKCTYVEKAIVFGKTINQLLNGNKNNIRLPNNVITYNDLVNNHLIKSSAKFVCEPKDIHNHVAVIVCSSGTTGLPKGVELTEYNVIVTLSQAMDRATLIPDKKISIGVIPWFHVYGCFTTLALTLLPDSELVVLPKFKGDLFLNSIQKFKATFLLLVPPLMVFLAKSPLVDQYDLSSIKLISSGAAPLGKEVERVIYERLNVEKIQQGFGMSEGTLTLLGQTADFCKPGSQGILRPGLWGKVIDPDTGISLGPNKPGELLFKGAVVMKGYIGDANATKNTIDKDGWLHSGDIGYYDQDGEWFIVDRLKELIKYKGFQVPPAELESILLSNPLIKDAAVIGVPDDEAGELPLAFVVKSPDSKLTEKEILDFVAERVSNQKRLRGGVKFINEIPKNLSGKILRRELRDTLKNTKSKL